ncbi:MAG: hypothetical protein ACK5BY_02775 [Limnohabitans sp.]|jgi:hypothetical protein|uniref:hypothetical protein n=1 Tax=Limnohabitans sp. TaxID=1907725 RepID=UPI00391CF72A
MSKTKKMDGEGDGSPAGMDFRLCDLDSSLVAGFSNEDFGSLYLEDLGGSSGQYADLGLSDTEQGSQGFDLELTDAESAIVRLAQGKVAGTRGRAAAAKTEKVYITHEDFDEGPERDAFLLIFGYAENLLAGPNSKSFNADDLKQRRALNFFFCNDPKELTFEDAVACIDNQIRLDVLRLRFMLEFWLRGWKLPSMPDNADGLPARVELMAAQYEAIVGIALAREAWFEPGIDAGALLDKVVAGKSQEIARLAKRALKDLVLNYVLSIADGKVYTTGKNPILELEDKLNDPAIRLRGQLTNIYWSRRF